MLRYSSQVSGILIAAFALSLLYELYRSTAKAGTSKHDSARSFLTQELPFYAIAFVLAVLVRTERPWVAWTIREGLKRQHEASRTGVTSSVRGLRRRFRHGTARC
jgi:hypothetical protein